MTMRTDLAIAASVPAATSLAGVRPRPRGEAAPAAEPGAATAPADRPGAEAHRGRWLYGPAVDFLLLGGGSFIVLAAMAAFFPRDEASRVALAGAMLFLAHFVNHPHFAHSYQIFYRGFVRKAFGPESHLAARYRFAGILVPAVLAVFFAAALAEGNVAPPWARRQRYVLHCRLALRQAGLWDPHARRRPQGHPLRPRRASAPVVETPTSRGSGTGLAANDALKAEELWGITYYLIDVPDPLLVAMVAAVAVSTLAVGRDLFSKWRTERALPLNGLLAYVAAVYVWLAVIRIDPVLIFVVPFFHSLQYLAVAWRYQLNVEADRCGVELRTAAGEGMDSSTGGDTEPDRPAHAGGSAGGAHAGGASERRWKVWLRSAPVGLARFLVIGGILGAVGFWWAPVAVDTLSGYDQAVFGATLFLFIGWTFVNIHHYFIDNVIWRRDNPEARRYLFGSGAR